MRRDAAPRSIRNRPGEHLPLPQPIANVAAMVRGHGFVAVETRKDFARIREALEGKYKSKLQTLGERKECVKEIGVLNEIRGTQR